MSQCEDLAEKFHLFWCSSFPNLFAFWIPGAEHRVILAREVECTLGCYPAIHRVSKWDKQFPFVPTGIWWEKRGILILSSTTRFPWLEREWFGERHVVDPFSIPLGLIKAHTSSLSWLTSVKSLTSILDDLSPITGELEAREVDPMHPFSTRLEGGKKMVVYSFVNSNQSWPTSGERSGIVNHFCPFLMSRAYPGCLWGEKRWGKCSKNNRWMHIVVAVCSGLGLQSAAPNILTLFPVARGQRQNIRVSSLFLMYLFFNTKAIIPFVIYRLLFNSWVIESCLCLMTNNENGNATQKVQFINVLPTESCTWPSP